MIEVAIQHEFIDTTLDIAFHSEVRTLALFGDSGAGKTSVLNVIAGLLDPRQGRVILDQRVLLDTNKKIHIPVSERRLGYIFQEGRLFPHLSVRGNLLYGAGRPHSIAAFDTVVALLELEGLLQRRPLSLSGGERQRVAIGRALLANPYALLLDEPLTGLHREARQQVLCYLQRLKKELQVLTILVSHFPADVAALAEEVVILRAGRIDGHMPITEFIAQSSHR